MFYTAFLFIGESIQKMLANLPPKRATRKVLQENTVRTQGRLRTVSVEYLNNSINFILDVQFSCSCGFNVE